MTVLLDRARRYRGPAGLAIGAAALFFLARTFTTEYATIAAAVSHINPWAWIVAFALFLISHVLGALEWLLIVRGLGTRLTVRQALKVHLTATVAKYLPGIGWQIASKIELAGRAGVPRPVGSASLVIELSAIILGGAAIALALLPAGTGQSDVAGALPVAIGGAVALIATAVVVTARIAQGDPDRSVRPGLIALACLAIAATWLVLSGATYSIAASLSPISPDVLPVVALATALGYVGSLLVVIAPAGIGVREGLLMAALSGIMPPSIALIVAVMSRLTMMLAEAIAFVVARRL